MIRHIDTSKKYCWVCDKIVDANGYKDDEVGFFWDECPECRNDSLEEPSHCEMCDAEMTPYSGEDLCPDCKEELDKAIEELVEKVTDLHINPLDIKRSRVIELIKEEIDDYI